MTTVLCQINTEGFTTKPSDIKFYGALRDKMIQRDWSNLDEMDFIRKVAFQGTAWYGCLFNGRDLMETGQQRLCWKAQTMVGVDIDHFSGNPRSIIAQYVKLGLAPWFVYSTFSDGVDNQRSFRLVWKVEVDLRRSYEEWASVIKALSGVTPEGDPRARDCSRMWQGGRKGLLYFNESATKVPYSEFTDKLNLK